MLVGLLRRAPATASRALAALGVLAATGCGDGTTGPVPDELAREVRSLASSMGIGPLESPPPVRPPLAELGEALMFDPVLSGNHDISCMTCHHPRLASADGLHLSVGQGAVGGPGPGRVHAEDLFIPRNAPPLFNLHALPASFWDGRLFVDGGGRMRSPAGGQLAPEMEAAFEFGALSALGLFPVTSREEMRGFAGNELAAIPDADSLAMWAALMARLGDIPEYRTMFEAAYPGTAFGEMSFAHASNAMAGFMLADFAFRDTPWDRFLAGDDAALSEPELEGARAFLLGGCASCHAGPALTDVRFHNTAVAQFGPGKGNGPSGRDDFGHFNVSGDPADIYAFRTPPLRNVALTGPWGHAGQFVDLRSFVDHYVEFDRKLHEYDIGQVDPVLQPTLLHNYEEILARVDPLMRDIRLQERDVDRITGFLLGALSDPRALDMRPMIPERVPSGLPVDR